MLCEKCGLIHEEGQCPILHQERMEKAEAENARLHELEAAKQKRRLDAIDRSVKAEALVADLENQIAELMAGMDQAEARVAVLKEELGDLVGAARGMPLCADDLCQGSLDIAIESAEQALSGDGSAYDRC